MPLKRFIPYIILFQFLMSCSEDRTLAIKRVVETPIIDGKIDSIYNAQNWTQIRTNIDSFAYPHITKNDFLPKFKALWDDKNCYFLFNITDDIKYSKRPSKSPLGKSYDDRSPYTRYSNDCIRIYFKRPDTEASKKTGENNLYNYNYVYNHDSIKATGIEKSVKGINFFKVDTRTGYLVEISIPWKLLNLKPKPGLLLETEVFVVDNDNDKILGTKPRAEATFYWHGVSKEIKTTEEPFGVFKLVEK